MTDSPAPLSEAQKLETLAALTRHLAAEVGTRPLDAAEVARVLNLAGEAAHGIMRPAAPVATLALGMLLGAAGELPAGELDARVARLRDALDSFDPS
ncbi:hypothetical protein JT358_00575 [Micrococcales bacterium 31B]|nr:hypothetical protein [Micrococcales bacterium 31B]